MFSHHLHQALYNCWVQSLDRSGRLGGIWGIWYMGLSRDPLPFFFFFCRRPLWAVLAWAWISTLWCYPSSSYSADHGVAHPPRCPGDGFGEADTACDMSELCKFPSLDSSQITKISGMKYSTRVRPETTRSLVWLLYLTYIGSLDGHRCLTLGLLRVTDVLYWSFWGHRCLTSGKISVISVLHWSL